MVYEMTNIYGKNTVICQDLYVSNFTFVMLNF